MTGIVKWWDEKKGYGYITVAQDSNVRDYFAHYAHIVTHHKFKKLKAGWIVTFLPEHTDRGWMAKHIVMVARDSKEFNKIKEVIPNE